MYDHCHTSLYIELYTISKIGFRVVLGTQLFYKISAQQFKHIVLVLLFISGCFMAINYWF